MRYLPISLFLLSMAGAAVSAVVYPLAYPLSHQVFAQERKQLPPGEGRSVAPPDDNSWRDLPTFVQPRPDPDTNPIPPDDQLDESGGE